MSRDDAETSEPTDDGRELDQQLTQYLKLGIPAATLICAVVAGVLQGAAAVILVLAAGALVTVIAVFWASIRTLVGETPLSGADAYAIGAPRAEEEQKRAVLRALKDLEFEHSVGKISEEDYQALVAKYRAEAKRLLRMLDEDALPGRQKVEALVNDRLLREGLADVNAGYRDPPLAGMGGKKKKAKTKKSDANAEQNDTKNADATTSDASVDAKDAIAADATTSDATTSDADVNDADANDADAKKSVAKKIVAKKSAANPAAEDAGTRTTCAACGTKNDADAVFCKKCGARQLDEEDEEEGHMEELSKADREDAS